MISKTAVNRHGHLMQLQTTQSLDAPLKENEQKDNTKEIWVKGGKRKEINYLCAEN